MRRDSEKSDRRIEARLAVLEALLNTQLKELRCRMDLKFDAVERARNIQATEYMRRLDDLNGEAERLRDMQASYIPREVFESKTESAARDIGELKMFQANTLGKLAVIAVISGIAASTATSLIVRYFLP